MANTLTRERAYQVLSLNIETGVLTWRVDMGSRGRAGTRAGSLHRASGYRIINVDGRRYREHVLIWFMLNNRWCPRFIDHRDGNRANNAPSNLRLADESQQRQNTRKRTDNACGARGVYLHKSGLYHARVQERGRVFSVGYFKTIEAASAAARAERARRFGEFASERA